jgi:hypothetical protein
MVFNAVYRADGLDYSFGTFIRPSSHSGLSELASIDEPDTIYRRNAEAMCQMGWLSRFEPTSIP